MTYAVTDQHTTNAEKFSPFLIYWKCNTAALGDGCCIISDGDGTVCTMDDTADGTVLTTYRIKSADWTNSIVAADPTSPNGLVYHTAMNALGTSPVVVVGATTGMDYMD